MNAQDLKNSILQLAVRGKLVPQDPTDEPASELLERIRKEKERLITEGKIRKEKPLSTIGEDEIPFDIPDTWEWCRLGDLAVLSNGDSINSEEKTRKYAHPCEGYNYIATKDVKFDNSIDYNNGIMIPYSEKKFKIAPRKSILVCMEGGSAGRKSGLLSQDVCFGNKLCCCVPIQINEKYLFYFVQSPLFYKTFMSLMTGIIGGVGAQKIKSIPFPLPPLAEQSRIVAKIEELLPKVTEYGEAQDRLTALNAEVPDKLRKSILQQAVQGKLTDRDPSDEPASLLLDRIRAEKARLIKEGKLREQRPLPPIADDEIPFDIPETWQWVRLGNIVTVNGGKRIPAGRTLSDLPTPYKYIRVTDMKNNTVCLDRIKYVPEDIFPLIQQYIIHKEDVYITVAGTIGAVGEIPEELDGANLTENADKLVFHHLNKKWLIQVLSSPCLQEQIIEATNKMSQPKLAIQRIQQLLIPLPPLAEQVRIVERVETLLAKCSDLK